MATRTEPTFVDPSGDASPGARLRQAREAANLRVGDIATALRLEPKMIQALESDSFDRLPAPTFVRGYLRGYARTVGLAPDPLLELYERHGFTPPAINPDPVETSQAHTSDLVFRLATFAIGAGLVVLVVLWWNSQDFGVPVIDGDLIGWSSDTAQDLPLPEGQGRSGPADGDEPDTSASFSGDPIAEPEDTATPALPTSGSEAPGTVAADSSAPAGSAISAATPEIGATQMPAQETEGPSAPGIGSGIVVEADTTAESEPPTETGVVANPIPASDEGPVVSASGIPEPTADAQPATDADSPAAADPVDAGDGVVEANPPADAATASATDSAGSDVAGGFDSTANPTDAPPAEAAESVARSNEEAPDDAPAPPDATANTPSDLVLEFAHESWVEVYDHERSRLFFGLVPPDQALRFTAVAPFDILLGFALDARITINGKAFDHTSYVNHGVARFTLDRFADPVVDDPTPEDDAEDSTPESAGPSIASSPSDNTRGQ